MLFSELVFKYDVIKRNSGIHIRKTGTECIIFAFVPHHIDRKNGSRRKLVSQTTIAKFHNFFQLFWKIIKRRYRRKLTGQITICDNIEKVIHNISTISLFFQINSRITRRNQIHHKNWDVSHVNNKSINQSHWKLTNQSFLKKRKNMINTRKTLRVTRFLKYFVILINNPIYIIKTIERYIWKLWRGDVALIVRMSRTKKSSAGG